MKKQFKLIKEYPGSPVLGTIYTALENDIIITKSKDNDSTNTIFASSYENYWEEIVVNDYEILSFGFYQNNSFLIANIQLNGKYAIYPMHSTNTGGNTLKEMFEMKGWIIYSVKRLSDGEIFTIGDYIRLNQVATTTRLIENIAFSNNTISLINGNNGFIYLKNAIKVHPLFKTADGYNVFSLNHQTLHWFDENSNISGVDEENTLQARPVEGFIHFKNKENLNEFLIENKKCLSYNDLKDLQNDVGVGIPITVATIKGLIIKKLKKDGII